MFYTRTHRAAALTAKHVCTHQFFFKTFCVLFFRPFPILTVSQTSLGFYVCSTSLLKTPWEKEKLLVTSNFSIFHSVFNPFEELSAKYVKFETVVCKLFQVGSAKNLSFAKGLK